MFCQECGKQIRETAQFCNRCGSPVQQRFNATPAAPPPLTPQPAEEKRAAPPQPVDHSITAEIRDPSGDHTAIVPVVPGDNSARARNRAERHAIFEPSSPVSGTFATHSMPLP